MKHPHAPLPDTCQHEHTEVLNFGVREDGTAGTRITCPKCGQRWAGTVEPAPSDAELARRGVLLQPERYKVTIVSPDGVNEWERTRTHTFTIEANALRFIDQLRENPNYDESRILYTNAQGFVEWVR